MDKPAATQIVTANPQTALELTDNIPVGTYVLLSPLDGPQRFTFLSKRWLEMTRLDPAKVMTDISHYFTVVHPDDREAAIAHNIAGNAAGVRYFWEGRWLQDGTIRWVTIESNPRRLPNGEVAWEGVVTDITARKQVEAELELARARERKREKLARRKLERKLKTSLIASAVAHEINQPLSSILLSVKMALERGSTDTKHLEALAAEAEFVVRTIERMKVLLRNVQTGHRPLNLGQVVKSSLLQVDRLLTAHGVTLVLDIKKHGARLKGDAEQLQIAIVNVLRNAVEAVTPCARREISVAVKAGKKHVDVVIGDSGPGWPATPPDEAPLGSTKHGGSGIGLFVVRTAVKNHRGKIELGRSPLGGAEVRLSLPVGRK